MTMQSDRFAAVGGAARNAPAPADDTPVPDMHGYPMFDVPENALDAISAIPLAQSSAKAAPSWSGGLLSFILHGGLAAALMTFGFNVEMPAAEGETAMMVTIIGSAPQDELAAADAEGLANMELPPLEQFAGPPPVPPHLATASQAVQRPPAYAMPEFAPLPSPVLTTSVPSKTSLALPPVEQESKPVDKPAERKADAAKRVDMIKPVVKARAVQKREPKPKPEPVESRSREKTKPNEVTAKPVSKKAAEVDTRADSPGKTKVSKTMTAQAVGKHGTSKGTNRANAKKGSADGTDKGQATEKTSGKSIGKTGNASASNYPGLVLRKIARTRQKSASARGNVVISFSVTSSGGLASVSVARSSGTSAVDAAALDHVRRSAPFPAPPAGAQTRFQIPVTIR